MQDIKNVPDSEMQEQTAKNAETAQCTESAENTESIRNAESTENVENAENMENTGTAAKEPAGKELYGTAAVLDGAPSAAAEKPVEALEKPVGKKAAKDRSRLKKAFGRRLSPWRVSLGMLSIGVACWGALPTLISGIRNLGVYVSVGVGLIGAVWGLWPAPKKKRKRKGVRRVLHGILIGGICLFATLGIVLSACMVSSACRTTRQPDATVIVLGAGLVGEYPSRMLADRLRAAAAYLEEHPDAQCIVSGGQGSDEAYSEAHVMKKYLTEQLAVEPDRVLMEDRSVNTEENIRFSMEIIRQEGLSESIVIATQEFHQYRASVLAKKQGVTEVAAVACHTPSYLLLSYWVRECAAICRLWLLGH